MANHQSASAPKVLFAAAALGAIAGIGSIALTPGGPTRVADGSRALAAKVGLTRQRPPRDGDDWAGCNDARAAGSAPIYRGEPGYRSDMDGDDDGIACEPIA